MRQVILATSLASAGAVASASTMGAVGFVYRDHANNDALKFSLTSGDFAEDHFLMTLKRAAANMGDISVPFHKNKLMYSKATVTALSSAGSVVADFTGVTITPGYDYTAIFVRKGIKFNERNKWTFTVRANNTLDASALAVAITKYVNDNTEGLGLTASNSSGVVTFTNVNKSDAYAIKFADDLVGVENASGDAVTELEIQPATVSGGAIKVADVTKYVADLVSKAAADAGFEDTYRQDNIYPGLYGADGADYSAYASGAIVYTFRFAEPRIVKTVDDVVNQVVQLVLPSSVTVTSFDTLVNALAKKIA